MKKIIAIVLCLLLAIPAFAATESDFTYWVEDGAATVTGYNGSATDIEVPSELGGCPVTAIGWFAFEDQENLKQIKLPDSITLIDEYAFRGCTALTEIVLPVRLKEIGEGAFADTALTQIESPAATTAIGEAAFVGCSKLTAITVQSGNTNYSASMGILFDRYQETLICFPAGKNVTVYTTPYGVKTIGPYAFAGCTYLQKLNLREEVTLIGAYAFEGCENLSELALPNGVSVIPDSMLYGCTNLKRLYIPRGITEVGWFAFDYCESLSDVYFDGDEAAWETFKSLLHAFDGTDNLLSATLHLNESGLPKDTSTEPQPGEKRAISISVASMPTKTVYQVGEPFDKSGLTVYIHYSDGTKGLALTFGIKGFDSEMYGEKTITVSASGFTATFTVTVERPPMTGIEITALPKKTTYLIGEKSDTAGLAVSAVYGGKFKEPVTGFTVSGFSSETAGKKTITVTYNGFKATFTVTVKAAAAAASKIDVTKQFKDVLKGKWYVKNGAIDFAVNNGLFAGITKTTFEPESPMTRAMYVTVLGRLAGAKVDHKATTRFADVPSGQWYTGYVKWAADGGIVNGVSPTSFAPNVSVTREQICKMMVEYCAFAKIKLKKINKEAIFKDANKISSWAATYVKDANIAGFVNGNANGTFNPQGSATRAEVATIFMNFEKNYHVL